MADGSGAVSLDPHMPPVTGGTWYRPAPLVTWHWQLQGDVDPTYDVEIYDIDLFESSPTFIQQLQADDKKVICYFSAGSYESWRPDAAEFNEAGLGEALDGWPGERWLDIRRQDVAAIMKGRLDLAVQKGCDGVEPDNMDGYANDSGFALTADDQLVFNRLIANEAHARGLSVGLKNDLDQVAELVAYYDFAVNEQCFEYDECEMLLPFIEQGKAVLNAEYAPDFVEDEAAREKLCQAARPLQFSTLLLPLELDDSFRYPCW